MAAVFSFLASCAFIGGTAVAQVNKAVCSFNGGSESCNVNSWADGSGDVANVAVTWLRDGKADFLLFRRREFTLLRSMAGHAWFLVETWKPFCHQ
jgi:hypothetical protein